MRLAVAATALGITLLSASGLAACTSQTPVQPGTPAPSVTPVFASDEEALAAAEALYGAYLAASDEVGMRGWLDLSPIEPFVAGSALEQEHDSAAAFVREGYRQAGVTKFDSATLQSLSDDGSGGVTLVIYLCLDVSGATVVDSEGQAVTVPDRRDRLPLEVTMDDSFGDLRINRSEVWSGDFC